MNTSRLGRRLFFIGGAGALGACAVKPVALDRTMMAGVKRVGMPTTGFPTGPKVDVIHGIGKQFGAIGLLTTAVVTSNRAGAVTDLMRRQGFDPHGYFDQQVAARLQARGLAAVPEAANPDRHDFLDSYPTAGAVDAVLDVYVPTYGFFANSDADSSPYRPGVAVSMRLVSTADRSILMQDRVGNAGLGASSDVDVAPNTPSFATFSAVTDDPARAVAALQAVLSYAADTVGAHLA